MKFSKTLGYSVLFAALANSTHAQETTYTLYGTPGLVEMPTARSAPDGEIIASYSHWNLQQKTSFTFQLTPRLSGTFRYSGIDERSGPDTDGTFDRSFDFKYRIVDETDWRPAIAIGIQDFAGTGILSAEYVVATKAVTDSIDVTAGLGWGRFASRGGFSNPLGFIFPEFEERPQRDNGEGGIPSTDQFFRGDAALFGGIDYRVSEKLSFQIEYSSDAYEREANLDTIDIRSPINVGMIYRPFPNLAFNLAYLQGSEIAGAVTVSVNPRKRIAPVVPLEAPVPLAGRNGDPSVAASWEGAITSQSPVARELSSQGIRLIGYDVSGSTARIRFVNTRYRSEAQATGRAVRVLSGYLPDTVETIIAEPSQNGIPLSSATFDRRTLMENEVRADGANAVLAASTIEDANLSYNLNNVADTSSRFSWGLLPYIQLFVFNANDPVQIDAGLELTTMYRIQPNLVIDGSFRQTLVGARDLPPTREDSSEDVPNVRSDGRYYGIDGQPVISSLTLTHYGRPGENLYSRASVGYLERMFGGVSGEVLWKPVDSRLALGAELNYAVQREEDMLFGFQDYDVVTGHLSAYYDFENGFLGQVDVGRYLAGDWGATFSLDREFENGWKVGAYFTLTDMPFEEFGEGSFDKGLRVTVPVDFFLGNPTRREINSNLNSLARDGGARLNVDGRLYEIVRDGHTVGPLGDTWGRFWQ